jgi:glycosidase
MSSKLLWPVFLLISLSSKAASIILQTKSATVWLPQQTITGKISGIAVIKLTWHLNNENGIVNVKRDSSFSFSIILKSTNNIIWVEDEAHKIISDTINYTLGYNPVPEVMPFAVIKKDSAILNLKIINNPYNLPLQFLWNVSGSPSPVSIHNQTKQKAIVHIPHINGNYFFNVTVFAGNDSATYKTYITRSNEDLHAFDISNDHAAWIDSAIIYEITPNVFVYNGEYDDITAKLPELKELGVNTIWLQPDYKTHHGEQGYDITDYFSLRPDLGTEKQLHTLIATAKNLNLRVLFDFVPNHTSIFHPYADEIIQSGDKSHYYNFYQHTNDGAQYSSDYKIDSLGFVHYFWNDLVNLDYNNPEVQQWIIEAYKYWLQKFNIDGYRIDAAWAYNARNPSFGKRLQTTLKSIKPDILLLVEDKGALSSVYKEGYDAAYDWTADTNWISSWSWATDYNPPKNPTIFNYPDEQKRSALLNKSFFHNGDTAHMRLRFLENNDQPRFITTHGLDRTKMASALLFSSPGLPMIYNGQEIGFERKPYSNRAIFKSGQSIQSLDSNNLFSWYQRLITLRLKYSALRSTHIKSLSVTPVTMYALQRWKDDHSIIVLMNLDKNDSSAEVNIHSFKKPAIRSFVDLLTKEIFVIDSTKNILIVPMKKYSTRLLLAQYNPGTVAVDK